MEGVHGSGELSSPCFRPEAAGTWELLLRDPLGCGLRLCIVLKAGEPHFHMQGGHCAFLDSLKANKLPRNGCVNLIFQAQTPLHEAGALCLPSGRTT